MGSLSPDGGRKPRVSDEEILAVFRESPASDAPLSTAEVAEELPIKRRATFNRLRSLRKAGDLESKKVGPRNRIWWLADGRDD